MGRITVSRNRVNRVNRINRVGKMKIGVTIENIDLPFLVMPNVDASINIRTLKNPLRYVDNEGNKAFVAKCEVLVNLTADSMVYAPEYLLRLTSTIYKGMIAEFGKNKIDIDNDLNCMIGRVWTITGKYWINGPVIVGSVDETTLTYKIEMRKDLELLVE